MSSFKAAWPRYALTILVTIGVTVVMDVLRHALDLPIVILIYLFTAALSATAWGLGPGLFAAVVSFLAFYYFFAPPVYAFAPPGVQDGVALGIFLIIALIISQLVRRSQASMAEARNREQEAIYLYELSSALANSRTEQTSLELVAAQTQKVLKADAVQAFVQRPPQPPLQVQLPAAATLADPAEQRVSIETASGLSGQLKIWRPGKPLNPTERRLLETFAGQTALALERTALIESENRAKVLEESDELKSALLSSVSHELRTPLATIRAAATSLQNGEVDWESQSRPKLLTAIDAEARRLDELVSNLLDMSKIEAGALLPDWQWHDLNEIVSSVLNHLYYVPQSQMIQIDFPADLPLLPMDYVQIEHVFANLFNNCLKYAAPATAILVTATVEPDWVQVEVTNEGAGVPEADLSRIFDKFYQVNSSDRTKGTGLGLSICKGIIETHGGRIWAENLPGHFAYFFTLPRQRAGLPAPILTEELETL